MPEQNDFFTVVDTESGLRTKITFIYDDDIGGHDGIPSSPVKFEIGEEMLRISPQQLTELAALFLALAGNTDIDYSSADALLDGFSLKGKSAAKKLAKALEE